MAERTVALPDAEAQPGVLEIGNVWINFLNYQVAVDGQPVVLTFQEFELLIERKIFVGLEPVAHLASAFLCGTAGIRALLRRMEPDSEPVSRFGDCEVDFARAELRRRGVRADLTAIELKMIEMFLRTPGRVLTRAQVIDEVWGRDVFVTDRVVDTHVVKLRRKIEADATQPQHIVSVRGIGYRFET